MELVIHILYISYMFTLHSEFQELRIVLLRTACPNIRQETSSSWNMKQQESLRTAGNVSHFMVISECMMFSLSWSEEIFYGNTAIRCERQLGRLLTTSFEELPSIRSTLSSTSCSTRQDSK